MKPFVESGKICGCKCICLPGTKVKQSPVCELVVFTKVEQFPGTFAFTGANADCAAPNNHSAPHASGG